MTRQGDRLKPYLVEWEQVTARYLGNKHEDRYLSVHPFLLSRILHLPHRRVLDFGCGDGRLTLSLARKGVNCVGVDASPKMVARAETLRRACSVKIKRRVTLVNCDERLLDTFVPAGSISLAVLSLVLMMLPTRDDIKAVLKAIHRTLARDGHLLVVVTHPAFRAARFCQVDCMLPNNFAYRSSGLRYTVVLKEL